MTPAPYVLYRRTYESPPWRHPSYARAQPPSGPPRGHARDAKLDKEAAPCFLLFSDPRKQGVNYVHAKNAELVSAERTASAAVKRLLSLSLWAMGCGNSRVAPPVWPGADEDVSDAVAAPPPLSEVQWTTIPGACIRGGKFALNRDWKDTPVQQAREDVAKDLEKHKGFVTHQSDLAEPSGLRVMGLLYSTDVMGRIEAEFQPYSLNWTTELCRSHSLPAATFTDDGRWYKAGLVSVAECRRPCRGEGLLDHMGGLCLFRKVSPTDMMQGQLGNCWFAASVAALAEFPERLMSLFKQRQLSLCGRYDVQLFDVVRDKWTVVTIDDRVPTRPVRQGGALGGVLGFRYSPVSRQQELWPCLLEKAMASLCGGYGNLAGVHGLQALKCCTGAPNAELLSIKNYPYSGWLPLKVHAFHRSQDGKVEMKYEPNSKFAWPKLRGAPVGSIGSGVCGPLGTEQLIQPLGRFDADDCPMTASTPAPTPYDTVDHKAVGLA